MARKLVLNHFRKTVASAGTAEAIIGSTTMVRSVTIQAEQTNTGIMYVGKSNVSSSNCMMELAAGNAVTIDAPINGMNETESFDISLIYIDASVSTDGVNVSYWTTDS